METTEERQHADSPLTTEDLVRRSLRSRPGRKKGELL